MRALVIDETAKAKVARLLAYAEQHHYRPGPGVAPPGDDDRFVIQLNTYRCVFTFTHADDLVWRDLSVSVPSENYPNPFALFSIAEMFGFTGWDRRTVNRLPEGWVGHTSKQEHAVRVLQPCGREGSGVH